MKIEIKNYRSCRGNEGDAYSASVYLDGKKAALVDYDGWGGEVRWQWLDQDLRAKWDAHVKALPPYQSKYFPEEPMSYNDDMALELEINRMLDRKACRTKTLFRPEPGSDKVFEVKAKFDARVRAFVVSKHPKAVFINEELA